MAWTVYCAWACGLIQAVYTVTQAIRSGLDSVVCMGHAQWSRLFYVTWAGGVVYCET